MKKARRRSVSDDIMMIDDASSFIFLHNDAHTLYLTSYLKASQDTFRVSVDDR